ncbi:hypothetical protein A3K81_02575 [Candidatus Bathyarchaeota archaeon RBG_13_60_20]|nr:MAG: hypothetical protein A3K81_02575 [Candidatus Bathyarchaeota archaeon RBG_13_60_20]
MTDRRLIRVLHIDDDSNHLQFTKTFLEKLSGSVKVTSATGPAQALALLKDQSFDCIICDYEMPSMNGLTLFPLVKGITEAPFILYTGHGSEEIAEAAFAAGINDYVKKELEPSHYQVLMKRITVAMENRAAEEETRRTQALIETFMDSATDGFSILDRDLNYMDTNKVIEQRLGLSKGEIVGKSIITLFPEIRTSGREERYLEVLKTGAPFRLDLLDEPNGSRYLQIKAFKVGDGLGIISTDITQLKRFEARLNALHLSATQLSQAGSLEEVSIITTQILSSALGYGWGDVGFMDGGEFVFYRGIEYSFPDRVSIPLNTKSVIARALRTLSSQVVPDVRLDPDYVIMPVTGYEPPLNLSELAVPIILDGESVGAINIESTQLNAFSEDDVKLLEILAQHVASAVRRIGELEDKKRQLEKLEALNQHLISLNTAQTLDQMLDVTYTALEKIIGFKIVDVIKVEDGRLVDYLVSELADPPYSLPLEGGGITVRAAVLKQTQYVPDVREDPDYVQGNRISLTELAVPVVVEGATVAVLNVEKGEPYTFTEQERKLTEALGAHAAIAIRNLRYMEALNRSEERYRVLLENTSDAVFVLDAEKYLYVNQKAADLMGYKNPRDLIGKPAFQGIDEADRERVRKYTLARLRGDDAPTRYQFTMKGRDGAPIVIENSATRIIYDGKVASLAINRDITERARYEETLTALYNHSVKLGAVKSVQDAASTTMNIMDQVFGWSFISFQVVEGEKLVNVDSRGTPPRGVPLPLEGPGLTVRAARSKRPVYAPDVHQDPGYIMVNSDTRSELAVPVIAQDRVYAVLNVESPKVEAFTEQDIRMLELLGMHVGAALARLEQEAEQEKASEGNLGNVLKGFDRVSRMIRHDLKGPLINVRNAAQLMVEDAGSSSEMISIINKNIDYMSYIVDDLRDLTSPKALKTELASLDHVVKRALEKRISPAEITLRFYLEAGGSLELDVNKMTRVIDNLLNNAIEAMPNGGTLKVSTEARLGESILTITDTGSGISDADKEKLFQPFFTTKETGMGLGLTYCREVVEAHRGGISISSRVGQGTSVEVRLPAVSPSS